jgi:glucokinase
MGGTNTAIGVVDARGSILHRSEISTGAYATGKDYAAALSAAINRLIEQNALKGQVRGIGMGAPNGNMNDGSIERAANIPWSQAEAASIPMAAMLTAETGLPCRLTNDANAAALGEMTYGSARGMKDFIVITLGTGLGSGIVAGGQLIVGHNGFAGELGHVRVVRENGRPCGCGRTGCLETYASATGVVRTAREWLALHPDRPSFLRAITHRPITSKDVFESAEKGDALAVEIFHFTGRILGEAFADFIAFSAPQAIILFGGLACAGNYLLQPLQTEMEKNLLSFHRGKTKIILSPLNDAEAAILGASALGWK